MDLNFSPISYFGSSCIWIQFLKWTTYNLCRFIKLVQFKPHILLPLLPISILQRGFNFEFVWCNGGSYNGRNNTRVHPSFLHIWYNHPISSSHHIWMQILCHTQLSWGPLDILLLPIFISEISFSDENCKNLILIVLEVIPSKMSHHFIKDTTTFRPLG